MLHPAVEELGSVHELTLAQSGGSRLDSDFSVGTPFGDLTFS